MSDLDGDGFDADSDCDDSDPAINPDAAESCNGVDDNCDGETDDASASDVVTFYADGDGDGYGDDGATQAACEQPEGFVTDGGDCDDSDAAYNPGATEDDCNDPNDYNCDGSVGFDDADGDGYAACIECDDTDPTINPEAEELCDGVDNNCDGNIDEGVSEGTVWYLDTDGDGYGDPTNTTTACTQPVGYAATGDDCNDTDARYYPGAAETCEDNLDFNCDGSVGGDDLDGDGFIACEECDDGDAAVNPNAAESCDGVDNNCDGTIDEDGTADGAIWYADADADGFGDAASTYVACNQPAGFVADATDCDDTDIGVSPAASELCNLIDDDCDAEVDEADAIDGTTWYLDTDADGYGDAANTTTACTQPAGYAPFDTDCNDADPAYNPGAVESDCADPNDYNCDGVTGFADNDGDTYAACLECDDGNAAINPGATEVCDGVDNNCDGGVDDAAAVDATVWYADTDADGFGDAANLTIACDAPVGYVTDATDCDDARSLTNPDAGEYCNGFDDNCDGTTDESTAIDALTWYTDADADGFGDDATGVQACVGVGVSVGGDCDDGNNGDNPLATEIVGNGDDEDCDGVETCYNDDDDDGYLDASGDTVISADADCDDANEGTDGDLTTDCDDTTAASSPGNTEALDNGVDDDCDGFESCYADVDDDGYTLAGGVALSSDMDCADAGEGQTGDATDDCDDSDASSNPGGVEVCDGADNDCDGTVDEGVGATWYADADGDGYGNAAVTASTCSAPAGYVATGTDCDDTDSGDYPGAAETVANGDDENCDGAETCYLDNDNDGHIASARPTVASADADCADANEGTSTDLVDDCDDNDAGDYLRAPEIPGNNDDENCNGREVCYSDPDNDGYLVASPTLVQVADTDCTDANEGEATDPRTDCDDTDGNDYPGAAETVGNGDDENCDGAETCYDDDDNDGYLDTTGDTRASADTDCADANEGTNADPTTDCNDASATTYPGAAEVCDSADNDCDGSIDEGASSTWYRDADGDTFGTSATTQLACTQPVGYVATSTDCNDSSATVYPGASEIIGNGIDESCDGAETCYDDDDNDGYLDTSGDTRASADADCADANEGTATDLTTDCNDAAAAINPGAAEVCDGIDQDCDGTVDDGVATTNWYADADGDTYGNPAVVQAACAQPSGYVATNTDCDDASAGDNPGATEIVGNEDDEDCDGGELCYDDDDGDGFIDTSADTRISADADCADANEASSAALTTDCLDTDATMYPGAAEVCQDTLDQDCDGVDDCEYSGAESLTGELTWTTTTGAAPSYGVSVNNSALGSSVAGGMDITGDGAVDVLVGDRNYDNNSNNNQGLVYLMDGGAGGVDTSLTGALVTFQISDTNTGQRTGMGLSMVEDVSGDSVNDLIISAPFHNAASGRADTGRVALMEGASSYGATQILDTNGTYRHVRLDGLLASDWAGYSVSRVGALIDGDTSPDWAVGAPGVDVTSTATQDGAVYIVSGGLAAGGSYTVATASSITINGQSASGYFGSALDTIDYNDDGVEDLIAASHGGATNGAVYIFAGPMAAGTYTTADADVSYTGIAFLSFTSSTPGTESAAAVANAGDNNGDGYADLVIGAASTDSPATDAGAVYLYLGNSTGLDASPTASGTGVLTNDFLGRSVDGAGDVDADGFDDLLVGAPGFTSSSGAALLVYGPTVGTISTTSPGAYWLGSVASGRLGAKVAGIGDVDADGWDDIFLGAPGAVNAGAATTNAYVIYGTGE